MTSADANAALVAWIRSSMLKQRIATAVLMVLIVLTALFLVPQIWFAALAALLLLGVGAWEAAGLVGLGLAQQRFLCSVLLCGTALAWLLAPQPLWTPWLWMAAVAAWFLAFTWLSPGPGRPHARWLRASLLALILLSAWLALISLHAQSPWLVVWLLVVIASADIGAYFTGRRIGGRKLAPQISPGKTRSGAIGGVLAAMVMAPLAAALMPVPIALSTVMALTLAGFGLAVISIGGDLFISLLKRQAQIKDSSHLLPGHGGLLDRLDSLGAALPFFALLQWVALST